MTATLTIIASLIAIVILAGFASYRSGKRAARDSERRAALELEDTRMRAALDERRKAKKNMQKVGFREKDDYYRDDDI